MKIGFFDSGRGGLSLMQTVSSHLPHYDYLYYGDTAHLPYGDRPETDIYTLTKRGVEYLFDQDAVLVIIACNTASVSALARLQDTAVFRSYPDRKVIGIIVPTIEEMLRQKLRKPLLIGTTRTVTSGKYQRELEKRVIRPVPLRAIATPWLVPFIEKGELERGVDSIKAVLDEHVGKGGDSVILGCTHYGLLKKKLQDMYGDKLAFISQHDLLPRSVETYLMRHPEIESRLTTGGSYQIHTTN